MTLTRKISQIPNAASAFGGTERFEMVQGGLTVYATISQFLTYISASTLSSLTVTGDLTVDTSTLKVDAANNRVGIGTASPASQLHVANATGSAVNILQLQTGWDSPSGNKSIVWTDANSPLGRISVSYDISSGSKMTFGSLFSGGYQTSDLLTLDASGNLGLGVTPSARFDLLAGTDGVGIRVRENSSGNALFQITDNPVTVSRMSLSWTNSTTTAQLGTSGILNFVSGDAARGRFTAGGYFKASNDGTYAGSTDAYHEVRQTAADEPALRLSHTSATSPYGMAYAFDAAAPNNTTNYFERFADTSQLRAILYSNGDWQNVNGVYGTISDEKVKQDITDAGSSWDDVKAYRWRKYRRRSDVEQFGDAAPWHLGVIAQEIEQVSAGLVDTHADTEEYEEEVEVVRTRPVLDDAGEAVLDDDGEAVTEEYTETEIVKKRRETGEVTKSVKLSILHNKAVVALQEAMARIETLETRLSALEA